MDEDFDGVLPPGEEEENDDDGLLASVRNVAEKPGEAADPHEVVQRTMPANILARYEVHSYRNAAVILAESCREEFQDIVEALDAFSLTTRQIRMPGGSESDIPKRFSSLLRPKGWYETVVEGDLVVRLTRRELRERVKRNGKIKLEPYDATRELRRNRFLAGHKIDYVKKRVAFDLEWNSKDQTFDRDLYAFNAFALCGVVDAAVLVTRSQELNPVFLRLGQALNKKGEPAVKSDGKTPSMTASKYGASTTWMGKLIYRLNAGRNGGCPVLAVGIRPACISDWES